MMENDFTLVATGYIVARIALLAAFGWVFYLVLRPRRRKIRVEDQTSRYALERLEDARYGRPIR